MTKIVVVAKESKILLKDTQSKEITLNQPSIIQVGVTQQEVKNITKTDQNLIITLKNGEQIVLDNFLTADATTPHSLVFPEVDGSFVLAHFNEQGVLVNYSGLKTLDSLLYEGAETVALPQVQAYQSTVASESDFSFSNLLSSSTAKAGLGIATAIGLGLALVDGNNSTSKGSIDITAPSAPKVSLSDDGEKITGTAEAGTTVYVVTKQGKVIASSTVDKDGNFSIDLPEPLLNNNTYYVNVKDKAGNASNYTSITGSKDTIAPDEPQAQLNDLGNIVTGRSEPNATINVFDAMGNLIGTAKASSDGNFTVPISPALSAGQIGSVEAVDAAGNKSEHHQVELGKDTIAPEQPKFEVNPDGTTVKGTAEAHAKVIIQDATGHVIGTGIVDANGQFSITVSPALNSTTAGKLIIEDEAGNQSKPVDIKAGQDMLPPDQPVANLNEEGTIVSGTAEANSKISVYDSTNKLIGSATADANGNYSITLSIALTEKKTATVYATDAAGNQSANTTVTGTKDVTAPDAPKITEVKDNVGETTGAVAKNGTTDDKRPIISGTGEAGATLIIFDNGKALGNVKVGTDGKWTYNFESDLSLGSHSITAVQTDKAGNTSLASDARTFTVIEPVVATANALEETSLNHDLTDVVAMQADSLSAPTTTNSTAIGISVSSVTELSSIANVLNGINQDVHTTSLPSTTLSQDLPTVNTSELLTSNTTDHSATSLIDNVIASVTPKTTLSTVAESDTVAMTLVNNITVNSVPTVVQSDAIADLLHPQVLIF